MSLLDILIMLAAGLIFLFFHPPLALTVVVTLAILAFERFLLGERVRRKAAP